MTDTVPHPLTLTSPLGRRVVVGLAVTQALLLLLFHEALAREWAWAESLRVSVPYLAVVATVPAALYLLLDDPRRNRPWLMAGALGLVVLVLGLYTGRQVPPDTFIRAEPVVAPFALSVAAGWFVAVALMQTLRAGRRPLDYGVLFEAVWYHLLTLALTALFVGLFWIVLTLWDALFDVLGVGFFGDVFFDRRFVYAATGLVGGLGIVIVRGATGATTALLRLVLALLKALLPLLAVVSLVFLAALPFTGVAPLWDTGHATALMLALMALMTALVNAAFEDGRAEAPYVAPVRRIVEAAFALLPVYGVLSAYALGLRVAQYGWTAERVWAALLVGVLGALALAYAGAAVRSLLARDAWMGWLRPVNTVGALVVLALLVLVHTPVLAPHRIAAGDQAERLAAGRADADVVRYLRFDAGAAGLRALRRLQATGAVADHPVIAARVDSALAAESFAAFFGHRLTPSPDRIAAALERVPDTLAVPDGLLDALADDPAAARCEAPVRPCLLAAFDLTEHEGREFVLFARWPGAGLQTAVFGLDGDRWQRVATLERLHDDEAAETLEALRDGRARAVPPERRDLLLGEQRLRVR